MPGLTGLSDFQVEDVGRALGPGPGTARTEPCASFRGSGRHPEPGLPGSPRRTPGPGRLQGRPPPLLRSPLLLPGSWHCCEGPRSRLCSPLHTLTLRESPGYPHPSLFLDSEPFVVEGAHVTPHPIPALLVSPGGQVACCLLQTSLPRWPASSRRARPARRTRGLLPPP